MERNFDSEGKIFSLILFTLWGKNAKTAHLIRPIILNLPHTDRRRAEILSASLCSYISMPNVSPRPRPATRVNKPACGAGTFRPLWWRENWEQKGAMSNTRRFQFLWNVPPLVFFLFLFLKAQIPPRSSCYAVKHEITFCCSLHEKKLADPVEFAFPSPLFLPLPLQLSAFFFLKKKPCAHVMPRPTVFSWEHLAS